MIVKARLSKHIPSDKNRWDFYRKLVDYHGGCVHVIRLMLDVMIEYEKRGGFLDAGELERRFIAAVEKRLVSSETKLIGGDKPEETPEGVEITFDPSQYGI